MRLPKSIRIRLLDRFRRWIRGQDNYQGRKKYPAGSGESWVCKEMKERGVYD